MTNHNSITTDWHFLLIFHGSARESAGKAAASFAEGLRSDSGKPDFSVCFLRGAEPSLEQAIRQSIASGRQKLHLIPLFLLPGAHIDEDIPVIADNFKKANPGVEFKLATCLVDNPQFMKFVASQMSQN